MIEWAKRHPLLAVLLAGMLFGFGKGVGTACGRDAATVALKSQP